MIIYYLCVFGCVDCVDSCVDMFSCRRVSTSAEVSRLRTLRCQPPPSAHRFEASTNFWPYVCTCWLHVSLPRKSNFHLCCTKLWEVEDSCSVLPWIIMKLHLVGYECSLALRWSMWSCKATCMEEWLLIYIYQRVERVNHQLRNNIALLYISWKSLCDWTLPILYQR